MTLESLTEQLRDKAADSIEKLPKEALAIMNNAIEEVKTLEVVKTALKVGDRLPNFSLPDVQKGMVNSLELLKKGPLLISFYRGGWCPYCNLQLRDLQVHLPQIKETGAQLVAISPQVPDETAETVKKDELDFLVLSDAQGKVGEQFGLMFKLPDDLLTIYRKFGIDLEKANGNDSGELPLAATYIVNTEGKIVYAFVDEDYKKRAETKDLIETLKGL